MSDLQHTSAGLFGTFPSSTMSFCARASGKGWARMFLQNFASRRFKMRPKCPPEGNIVFESGIPIEGAYSRLGMAIKMMLQNIFLCTLRTNASPAGSTKKRSSMGTRESIHPCATCSNRLRRKQKVTLPFLK